MEVPKLDKIVVNMGVGEAVGDSKVIHRAVEDLGLIAGQKPVITKARKSIANFKLREDMPIGAKVTLRGRQMYEFLDRLVTLPCRGSGTFAGFRPRVLTATAIMRSVSRSTSCFRRSITTRFSKSGVWTLSCAPPPNRMTKRASLLRGFNFPFSGQTAE